ncbi:MAG: hypothetical protein LBI79_02075 [Nitrososphaerota archaeon]|nr:hypothetical protein [Nitrososphaerota archaeon]
MKRVVLHVVVAVLLIVIVLIAVIAIVRDGSTESKSVQPFYVGVTFSGGSVADAKLLIDKVKDYTNLFVMQSGSLMYDLNATEEICDYAVDAGLNIILSYTHNSRGSLYNILNTAPTRWGNHFLGIYYNDEPGGKMLDEERTLYNPTTQQFIYKMQDKTIQCSISNSTTQLSHTIYSMSGAITTRTRPLPVFDWHRPGDPIVNDDLDIATSPADDIIFSETVYYPNGTICYTTSNASSIDRTLTYQPDGRVQDDFGYLVSDQGNISQFQTYQEVYSLLPVQTYSDVAYLYIVNQQDGLSVFDDSLSSIRLFTSDYALYWWDYQSGYDVVFAQLGWNNSVVQEVGLVRGAASLQGKSWGMIITWTYTHPPYLIGGEEMYSQMCASYEAGAEYVVVFNYAGDMSGAFGTLQEEHFCALERFWVDVVQNDDVVQGGIRSEVALVLPKDYGWGMRGSEDNIWGLWNADDTSRQIWVQLQNKLAQYGLKLDIIFDTPTHGIKYNQIYYWQPPKIS